MSPPRLLVDQHPGRGLRDEERALRHHVVLEVPVGLGGLEERLGQRQAGVVDDQVEPAEGEHGGVDHRPARRPRRRRRRRPRWRRPGRRSRRRRPAALASVEVGDHDAGTLGGELLGGGLADAAGGAGDQRDPGGERLGLRHPLELGLLERPVLDAELLRLVDRGVRREALGPTHHVDRVDVELAGHAGGLLVLAEAEHPDAGHQHDQRVGAADRRRVRRRVAVVVALVVLAVGHRELLRGGRSSPRRSASAGRSSDHRLDLGAQEVVGARGAELGQARVLRGRRGSRGPRRSR